MLYIPVAWLVLIILIAIAIGGYFIYQHFFSPSQQVSEGEPTSTDSGFFHYIAPLPEECKNNATEFENAVYSSDTPMASFAQRNHAKRSFITCLHDAGFSDQQISTTFAETEERVKGYIDQDRGINKVKSDQYTNFYKLEM